MRQAENGSGGAASIKSRARTTTTTGKTITTIDTSNTTTLDRRHPLYLGDWKRSIPVVDNDIAKDDLDEPHIKRKRVMLEKHPEIVSLYGHEPLTKWITLLTVACQVLLSYFFGRTISPSSTITLSILSQEFTFSYYWPLFVVTTYIVGGGFTQVFGVIIHEATHALCFENKFLNRINGLVANIGIVFPIAMSFRRYHLEHHAFQGVIGRDPDLPLSWEYKLIKSNPFAKLTFLFFYPLMYVVRGAAMGKQPSMWELINWIWTITSDIIIWKVSGPLGFLYLFCSLWFGYGIHPAAAHFIQEHFTFDDGQETYSYYGGLNYLFLNIGYHNEHHDFTKVAWSKLPALKNMASEFYDSLKFHNSWVMVLVNFVLDPTIGPQSRVGRDYEDHRRGRKMLNDHKSVNDEVDQVKEEVTPIKNSRTRSRSNGQNNRNKRD